MRLCVSNPSRVFPLAAALACGILVQPAGSAPPEPDFETKVAPILTKRCLECHNAGDRKGELNLTTREGLMKGGESGAVVVPKKPEESVLFAHVTNGEMPPPRDGQSRRLPDGETDILLAWIAAGVPWDAGRTLSLSETTTDARAGLDWWSLQPVRPQPLPKLPFHGDVESPIDMFVLARLQRDGMTNAPLADRRMLIRRLYFDLIGWPPTFEEVEVFAAQAAPDAYERLVDRLLASPHFGERWARYWLDLVRYAETCGYERDQEKPGVWKYRDWVVDAINRDMPYDQFVLDQLAGDEVPDRTEQSVIATGFLRLGTWNDEPNDALEYKYERLEDLVHTTSTAFLGLTVKCARCHDHKFDPIPQVDYYKLAAVFWAGHVEPRGANLLGGPSKEELGFDVFGYTDRAREPPPLHLLRKGDPHHEEQVIPPGYLSLIPALNGPMAPAPPESQTSRRRLQLAQWVTDPRNPLTSRVAVNRLWQHHLGEGLVRTPDNFGFNGQRPTHPELLDWLAGEFVQGDWEAKRIHREIVGSQTYRQSSVHPRGGEYRNKDADNRLWWRANRRRRDAESLRDAMLAVSGKLDLAVGGPSFRPDISEEATEGLSMKGGAWKASPASEQRRRSLYIYSKRALLPPFMTVLDFCDTSQPCARRDVTIVAPQALALLNNTFVHDVSDQLADAILVDTSAGLEVQVEQAWMTCLGRPPTMTERAVAADHMQSMLQKFAQSSPENARAGRMALASLCHVLLNSNEFMYVD